MFFDRITMKTLGIVAFILLISTAVAIFSQTSTSGTGGRPVILGGYHSFYDEKDNEVIECFF